MNTQNLKKAREATHLTQSQVAEKLGVTHVTYQNYEYGKREPNNALLCNIADLFHVTTDYLLGRDVNESEPVEQLVKRFNLSVPERDALNNYLSLPDSARRDFVKIFKQIIHEVWGLQSSQTARHAVVIMLLLILIAVCLSPFRTRISFWFRLM